VLNEMRTGAEQVERNKQRGALLKDTIGAS
jgi:hypothetical protein